MSYVSGSKITPSGFGIQTPKPLPASAFEVTNTEGPIVMAISASASNPPGSSDTIGVTRAVYVGSGGNITFRLADSSSATFRNVDDGTMLPVRVTEFSGSVSDVEFLY